MEIEPTYEMKFHLYDGNEDNLAMLRKQYDNLRSEQRGLDTVMSKVSSYFFEGAVALVEGDQAFRGGKYRDAVDRYNEAHRMFSRFSNSRTIRARMDFLADRYLARSLGLKSLTEGIVHTNTDLKQEAFSTALTQFNEEVTIANQMAEVMSSYAAYSRAAFTQAFLLLEQAESMKESNSGEAKRDLMLARAAVREAAFINPSFRYMIDFIEDRLDDMTKNRLLIKAEELGDKATILSEDGQYREAKVFFQQSSLFFHRASSLSSDTSTRRFLLSTATLSEASVLEAEANHLFRRENSIKEAAETYEEAAKHVEKAIALMGQFGTQTLKDNFSCQQNFYHALALQCIAIYQFDEESYAESLDNFKNSKSLFKTAIDFGIKGGNKVIIDMGNEAIAEVDSYISMNENLI